jgi:prepilin-type N-terminal cleavage/methylation domain-containing protein
MKRAKAFTLIEVMTVIAIIAILTAIAAPVLIQAKKHGKRPGQASSLHQTGLALAIYAEDYGGEPNWPTLQVARAEFNPNMMCDPLDSWRENCNQVWDPLLGSYGYAINDLNDEWFFGSLYEGYGSARLLVSIFDPGQHPDPFQGNSPTPTMMADPDHNYKMPAFVTLERSDLSVGRVPLAKANLGPRTYMAWRSLIIGINVARL